MTTVPQTPQEVRDLLLSDPVGITDQHLLALILAQGSSRRRPGRHLKSWTTVALAEDLYQAAGGLKDLVERTCSSAINLKGFGIGKSLGGRLIAAMNLAQRWHRGFKNGGDCSINSDDMAELRQLVFLREIEPSEAELIAVVIGLTYPDQESTAHLLDEFGSPQNLMTSLALDAFESFRKNNVLHFRLPKTDAAIEFSAFCRLFAAVELAHRYRAQTGPRASPLAPGVFGLQSAQLAQLLDPTSTLDPEFRMEMIEVLRSHPELGEDFARLDLLASDAQTKSYQRAIELNLMFEQLRKRQPWSHPSEVLGDGVPYAALLAIAEARIERSSRRPVRLLKIKEMLEQAEREAMAGPIDGFVEALLALDVSTSSVERAIEEAGRQYLERAGSKTLAAEQS